MIMRMTNVNGISDIWLMTSLLLFNVMVTRVTRSVGHCLVSFDLCHPGIHRWVLPRIQSEIRPLDSYLSLSIDRWLLMVLWEARTCPGKYHRRYFSFHFHSTSTKSKNAINYIAFLLPVFEGGEHNVFEDCVKSLSALGRALDVTVGTNLFGEFRALVKGNFVFVSVAKVDLRSDEDYRSSPLRVSFDFGNPKIENTRE